jgi:S1-C subfamily serine protease
MTPLGATATGENSLDGFRYLYVVSPTYEGGAVDSHGFARVLASKFAQDGSWTLLNSPPDLAKLDPSKANETVVVTIEHTWSEVPFSKNQVTLRFFNLLGEAVAVYDGSSGMGMTAQGDINRAINGAFKRLQKARPHFVPGHVSEITAKFANQERFDMEEASFRAYLDDNRSMLKPLEGIWTASDGKYRVGVIRTPQQPSKFIAFVLESKHPLWKPQMVKAKFEETANPDLYSARYYSGDHTELGTTAKLEQAVLSFPLENAGRKDIVSFVRNYPTEAGSADREAESGSSTGTGFAVAPSLVATCFHVVRGAKRMEIVFDSSKDALPLELLLQDEANDLAVLRVLPSPKGSYRRLSPLTLADSASIRLGEDVYTVGYPLGDLLGESAKVTTGVVSALVGLHGDARTLQVSAPVQPGNSGGPLLNSKGLVTGVVVASLSAKALYEWSGVLPQKFNFVVRSDYVRTLLKQVAPDQPSPSLAVSTSDRAAQVDLVRHSVGQIRVYR